MDRRELLEAAAILMGAAATTASPAQAADTNAAAPVKVTELQRNPLTGSPGKQVVMVEVNIPPGGSSPPHKHSGPVFSYVLEGEVVFRLDDGPERTLRAGEVFHEEPGQIHTVSRNPSRKKRARLLAIIIGPENEPITTPVH